MKAILFAVVALTACHHSPTEIVEDFAGSPMYDLTAVASDDAGGHDDGGVRFDASGAGCDPTAALDGGSVTGSWTYVSGCAMAEAFYQIQDVCTTVAIDSLAVTSATGTLTLRGNLTYTRNLAERITGKATFPSACVGTLDCAQYQIQLTQEFGWLGANCGAGAGGCACALSMTPTFDENGTWVADPAGFTLMSTGGQAQHYFAGTTNDPPLLRYRGDDNTARGDRGVALVLQQN